jgi:hypothetical protein
MRADIQFPETTRLAEQYVAQLTPERRAELEAETREWMKRILPDDEYEWLYREKK